MKFWGSVFDWLVFVLAPPFEEEICRLEPRHNHADRYWLDTAVRAAAGGDKFMFTRETGPAPASGWLVCGIRFEGNAAIVRGLRWDGESPY